MGVRRSRDHPTKAAVSVVDQENGGIMKPLSVGNQPHMYSSTVLSLPFSISR